MTVLPLRAALLGSAALSLSAPALADTPVNAAAEGVAEGTQRYLGNVIVVERDASTYGEDDGSSATKTPTPLIDVPQSVAMITEEQLDDQAITQLADALRYVPGVTLDTGEGHRDAVYIRGQSSTADFFVDGLRDDAQYYRPLYATQRVEVLKGANALIFGRGAGGGAINRVSKTAGFDARPVELGGTLDSFGAFTLSADANQALSENVAARISTTYEEFANHRDFYEGRFFGIAPTATVRLGEATRLHAFYSYDDDDRVTDRGIPSLNNRPLEGYDRTFFGDRDFNRATSQTHVARLRLEHDFGNGVTVNATGQYANYDKFYANVVPSSATATTVSLSGYTSGTQRENWIGQANLVWEADFGGIGSTLLTGIEATSQDTAATRNLVVFDGSTTVDLARVLDVPAVRQGALDRSSTSDLSGFSAYIQEQLDFGPLQVVGGVRYEVFDLESTDLRASQTRARKDEKVSPRIGVIAKPMSNLSLYASWSTSFLPQSGDQFTTLDDSTAALEPEMFENIELGAKWAITPQLFATAALFRLDRDNTRWTDPLTGITQLTGASRTKGLELSLTGEVLPKWNINYGYTLLDGEITSDTRSAPAGTQIQQMPRHQIALWNRYDFTDRFGIGAGLVHQGKQFASLSNTVVLPSYWRLDAAAFWKVSDRFSLQLNVENLTDADYYASAHGDNNIQPGKPITAKIGVRLDL